MLRRKNSNKIDYENLNEVIDISKRILKVTLYLIILALVVLCVHLGKEVKIFSFIINILKVATPFFINNISQNYYLNKFVKKTTKPFAEREGDWICPECKNLNFAFRLYCNRCKHPKENSDKKSNTVEKTEENKNVKKEEVTKNTKKDLKGLKEVKNSDVETIKVPIGQVKKSKNKYNRKHKKGRKSNANKEGENKKKE